MQRSRLSIATLVVSWVAAGACVVVGGGSIRGLPQCDFDSKPRSPRLSIRTLCVFGESMLLSRLNLSCLLFLNGVFLSRTFYEI